MRYLVQPIVNLNGSTRKQLVEQQLAVIDALNETLSAMAEAMPHGRDYQTQAPGTYQAARDAYLDRRAEIVKLRDELEAYVANLCDAGSR